MQKNAKEIPLSGLCLFGSIMLNAIVLEQGLIVSKLWYALLPVTIVFSVLAVFMAKRVHR